MMARHFSSILIPVDFSLNTEVAVSKALEITRYTEECSIHLFHVQQIILPNIVKQIHYLFKGYSRRQVNTCIEKSNHRLSKLKSVIEGIRKDINVFTWVSFGDPVEQAIINKAARLAADLIIIGKRSHHASFPFLNTVMPSRLAAASGIPVLTSKPGSLNYDIKTVVIPVDASFPASKLAILDALRKQTMLQIRLVVFTEDEHNPSISKQSLLNTFRTLKSQSANPVSYEILTGTNKARALLKYCGSVGADILIVHPGSETRVGFWTNSHISDLLPSNSKTQVLAVKPG